MFFAVCTLIVVKTSDSKEEKFAEYTEPAPAQANVKRNQEKAEYFEKFQYNLAKLNEWADPQFSDDIAQSELRLATGIAELNGFAKILRRSMRTTAKPEDEAMVHQFATTLEKRQRTFFTGARLFTGRRLNSHLAVHNIKARVPPVRNTTLEIYGPSLYTEEERKQIIAPYIKELYLARFKEIQWKMSNEEEPIANTPIYGPGDDTFVVDRGTGPNLHFQYHY